MGRARDRRRQPRPPHHARGADARGHLHSVASRDAVPVSDACCAPGRGSGTARGTRNRLLPAAGDGAPDSLVTVPGGRYRMGDESAWSYPGTGRGRCTTVELTAFHMDATPSPSPVRRVRRGHGVADRGRAVRMVLRLRWVAARRLPAHAGVSRVRPGGARSWGPTGPIPRDLSRILRIGGTIPLSTSRGTTRRPIARGPGHDCQRRRNGRRRPEGDSRAAVPVG